MSGLAADILIVAIIALIVSTAVIYIIKEKKKGRACIGCPSAGSCPKCHMGGES